MKKVFNLLTIAILGNLLLATSCNLDKDDTPQDEYSIAAVQTSSAYPYKDYLLLANGVKLLPRNTVLPNVVSGDLALVLYSIESEHAVNDTNQFRYKVLVKDASKVKINNILSNRFDTLGNASFTGVQPYIIGNFMWIKFAAYGDNNHRFFIAKDSTALAGVPSGLVKNNTMYIQLYHRGSNTSYTEGVGDLFVNLKNALRQSPSMPTDSVTVSIKFAKGNETEPNYKLLRFKASAY